MSVSQDLAFFLRHFVECSASARPPFSLSSKNMSSSSSSSSLVNGSTSNGVCTRCSPADIEQGRCSASHLVHEKMDDEPAAEIEIETEPRPPPLDLSHHLSLLARSLKQSNIKGLYKYRTVPGIVNLAGGLPAPSYFPFDTLSASVASSDRFAESMNASLLSMLKSSKRTRHITVPKFDPPAGDPLTDVYLASALQYSAVEGFPKLRAFVKEFAVKHQHQGRIPYDSPEVIMTCGNTDGLSKALNILGDRARGDKMLVEKYVYSGGPQTAAMLGIGIMPVEMDKEGMMADGDGGLREILDSWDTDNDGPRPHLMYTVTQGQNPTSGVLGIERRREIYALCQQYDIIILEDDPYWFLQYDLFPTLPDNRTFLARLTPSYITLDTDGRVLRFDTFSKSMAPGCRLGWLIGHPRFTERILRLTDSSTQFPSGAIQALVSKLLVNTWGMSGWITWLSLLREKYEQRATLMCAALEESRTVTIIHLKNIRVRDDDGNVIDGPGGKYSLVHKAVKELYEFERPMGGMFVWVRVYFEIHRLYDGTNGPRIMDALFRYLAGPDLLCLVCPGQFFVPPTDDDDESHGDGWKYLRLCFAAVEMDDLKRASENFGRGVKEFFELTEFPPSEDEEKKAAAAADAYGGELEMGVPHFC
ncbi:Aromatic amino acid aminotransferase [Drechslerella dactyloides]|uniref:Aromatic amino acid aminotransferase n=1 Tax=Drechslerella dactyloides TaxID=74499 RepID=A0AAD6NKW7_DREDA|nr:Aromatic amino acid aminotransferase [Drechslerella dactyloides]